MKNFRAKIEYLTRSQEKALKAVKEVVTRAYGYAQAADKMSKCFKNLTKVNEGINYDELKISKELAQQNKDLIHNYTQTGMMETRGEDV